MSFEISRKQYADLYGPTTGDGVRLADTDLVARVEKDLTNYGEEVTFGGGKSIRDGMGQNGRLTRDEGVPDTVITRALIIDHTGVFKADIGITDGRISGIGKAGNPDVQDDIDIPVGVNTEIIAGEHHIITAGGLDTHIHYISPDQAETALDNGVTTFIGGGTGPSVGTKATTITPGEWHIQRMIEATADLPINVGFLGKGHASTLKPLEDQIRAGAIGLKVHEDWGSTASSINRSLEAADNLDVQIAIHTDTLNEGGYVDNTIDAIAGRVIHTYHTEGAGGGHAPDILKLAGLPNIMPASTNPTLPYTTNTIDEHLDMLMVCHHLNPDLPEDVAFADSRIRGATIGAEDVLHDLGIFSITSSDSQAMGRVGEVVLRTWQVADKMKKQRGAAEGDSADNDNNRIKRYVSKYTINPALTHGVAHEVGSVEVGKLADLVIWQPKFFGVKPHMVIKGGQIVRSEMGDSNGSIPTPQPVSYRNSWGSRGDAVYSANLTFLSQSSIEAGVPEKLGMKSSYAAVKDIRELKKSDLKFNGATPTIEVDPQTYEVRVDGELIMSEPVDTVPMGQRYFLF